jgi:putative FmdB family regulatory protein
MPFYPFTCESCGGFEEWRSMSEATRQAYCPVCQRPARRIYTPPSLVRTSSELRRVLGYEEKSAHEPEMGREPQGRPLPFQRRGGRTVPWAVGG